MASKFIGFKPLSSLFKEVMEPYQQNTEKGEMSALLEVDVNYYRILRTTVDGVTPGKMVVCREEGQIEKSEEITRKCFQFYVYLALHVINQKNFSFDTTQAVKSQHEPLIQAFQTMVTDLTPILSTDEQEAMEFHLYYLQEVYRLSVLIADLSKALLTYGKQQEELNDDTLSSTQMVEIIENTKKWILLRDQLESILIEDGESARATVKSILKKRHYKKQLSNKHERRKVFKEMNDATYASRKYIKAFKKRYKEFEGTLEIDKGSFLVGKLIDELYSGNYRHKMEQMNVENMIMNHWILSSNCQYK